MSITIPAELNSLARFWDSSPTRQRGITWRNHKKSGPVPRWRVGLLSLRTPRITQSHLEQFVTRIVAGGRFHSEEDVVAEALRLLEVRERKLEALRKDIQVGIDQLDRGEGLPLDVDDIMKRGRERLTQRGE